MANKLYPESAIQGIADAIRSLNGTSSTYKVSEMARAISALPAGGGDLDELISIFNRTLSGTYTTSVEYIDQRYAFASCASLTSVNLPNCKRLGISVFYSCTGLTTISCPELTTLGSSCFMNCQNLSSIKFDKVLTTIPTAAFQSCYNLLSVTLATDSMGMLTGLQNNDAFISTPISNYTTSTGGVYGSIYVPFSLLASYKTATNWVNYSNRMVGI